MKNKLQFKFLAIVSALGIMAGATSCNSNESHGDPDKDNVVINFATFVSTSDKGSVFTVQQSENAEEATLTTPTKVQSQQFVPVCRVLLAYIPQNGNPFASGPITLYGVGYVYNGTITEGTSESTAGWSSVAQKVYSIDRTGKWLNLWTQCDYSGQAPARYDLVVDKTTLEEDYPTLHLIYNVNNGMVATKDFYSSFDLSPVWDLPTSKGVVVNIVGLAGNQIYKFEKPSVTVEPTPDI